MTLLSLAEGSLESIGFYFVIGGAIALAGRQFLLSAAQYRHLTLDHLLLCLRQPDDDRREEIEQAFATSELPATELQPDRTYLRLSYRQQQREMFLCISEEYERIRHNGLLLKYFLSREYHDIFRFNIDCEPEVRECLAAVLHQSIAFCKVMRWVPYKIWAFALLHPFDSMPTFPLPSISRLRTCRGTDILRSYADLANAAVDFVSLGYSTEFAHALAQELGLQPGRAIDA
jgi:hypothetical protein